MLSFCWLKIVDYQKNDLTKKTILEIDESVAAGIMNIKIIYEIPLFTEYLTMKTVPMSNPNKLKLNVNENININKYVFIAIRNSIRIFNEHGILKTIDIQFLMHGISVLHDDKNTCSIFISINHGEYLYCAINLENSIKKQIHDLNTQKGDLCMIEKNEDDECKEECIIEKMDMKPFHYDMISNIHTLLPYCEEMIILNLRDSVTSTTNSLFIMIGITTNYGLQLFKERDTKTGTIYKTEQTIDKNVKCKITSSVMSEKKVIPSETQASGKVHPKGISTPFKCSSSSIMDTINNVKKSIVIRSKYFYEFLLRKLFIVFTIYDILPLSKIPLNLYLKLSICTI